MPGVPGAERPLVQWLLVAMCGLIVVLAVLLVRRERAAERSVRALKQELAAATATQDDLERRMARERSAREAFQIGLERERARDAAPAIALQPGLAASGAPAQRLELAPDARPVRLLVPLGGQRFERYRANVRPFNAGDDLWMHGALRAEADGKRLFVEVPAAILPPGAYELSLQGKRGDTWHGVATFTFEVAFR